MTKDEKQQKLWALANAIVVLDMLADTGKPYHGYTVGDLRGITDKLDGMYQEVRDA